MSCNADEEPAGLVNAGGGGTAGTGGAGQAGSAAGASGTSGSVSSAGGGGSAGAGTAGSAGATGGAGNGGVADAGPDQNVGSDAGPEANTEAGSETGASNDAGDSGNTNFAVFVGSDYVNGPVKIAAVDWGTKQVAGRTTVNGITYGDALATTGGGRAFMLERSDDKLVILQKTQPWLVDKTVDLKLDDGGDGTDPFAVVSTGTKAYVPLYHRNTIAIVDVTLGTVAGTIDLSAFSDPADIDGLVDVFDGAYDPVAHRAYFLLQRIPQLEEGIEPDRASHCIGVPPVIVGVDTTNDQIIDLNGDGGGTAAVLLGQNPSAFVPDIAGGRLLVVEAGCYISEGGNAAEAGADAQASVTRTGRGVEALSLSSATSSWLYVHGEPGRLSGLVWVDGTHAFLSIDGGKDEFYATHWFSWNPTTQAAAHGAEVTGFPNAARYIGANQIVGLASQPVDGGSSDAVVSFDVGTGTPSTLVPDVFAGSSFLGDYNGWGLVP
jgi:hypothetical protein